MLSPGQKLLVKQGEKRLKWANRQLAKVQEMPEKDQFSAIRDMKYKLDFIEGWIAGLEKMVLRESENLRRYFLNEN